MSYLSLKRRLSPPAARGIAALLSALMVGGLGVAALTPAQAATLPTDGQVGTVQTMAGGQQGYQQFTQCQGSTCTGDGGYAPGVGLFNPRALAFAPNGDVYIADALNERIRKITIATGNLSTFAGTGNADTGGGPANGVQTQPYPSGANGDGLDANQALFNQPHGVAVDSQGNVYVADSNNHKIRKINAADHVISTISGSGDPHTDPCPAPISPSAGCKAAVAGLKFPKSMVMAPGDKLYVADSGNNMVRVIDLAASGGPTIKTVAGTTQSNHFNAVGRDANGFDTNGQGFPLKAIAAQLDQPEGVAVDAAGNVYISDSHNNLVRKIDVASGNIRTLAGDTDAARTHAGDPSTAPEWDSDSAGDDGPAIAAHLDGPRGIAVDSLGNVYIGQEAGTDKVADTTGSRIRRIDTSGKITTIAGDGRTNGRAIPGAPGPTASNQVEFNTMHDLAIDSRDNLWIADSKNNLVRILWHPAQTNATTITPPPPPPGNGGGGGGGGTVIPAPGKSGYWMLGNDGKIYAFGDAANCAGATMPVGVKAVRIEPTPSGNGCWIVDEQGSVYTSGDAVKQPGAIALVAGEKVSSLSATPKGDGYWIFTSKGRVITFGAAQHYGDMSKVALNGPVLGSIATPSGLGYYMVGSDGGVFSFGDAAFHGSTGNLKLNQPVQSLVPTRDGKGYWLVASDGGIFAFDAPFQGSMGDKKLNKPVVGMVRYGNGYLMVGADGGIFNFSDKQFKGSLGDNPPARPIVFAATLDS